MERHYRSSSCLTDKDGNIVGYYNNSFTVNSKRGEVFVYRYENEWMDWLKRTNNLSTVKVFYSLTCMLNLGSPIVYLSPLQRDTIQVNYGLSDQTICSALNELERSFVIIRGSVVDPDTGEIVKEFRRGEMMINPSVAWKGKEPERKKAIEEFFGYVDLKKKANETK